MGLGDRVTEMSVSYNGIERDIRGIGVVDPSRKSP